MALFYIYMHVHPVIIMDLYSRMYTCLCCVVYCSQTFHSSSKGYVEKKKSSFFLSPVMLFQYGKKYLKTFLKFIKMDFSKRRNVCPNWWNEWGWVLSCRNKHIVCKGACVFPFDMTNERTAVLEFCWRDLYLKDSLCWGL